jgi:hypothetical protein
MPSDTTLSKRFKITGIIYITPWQQLASFSSASNEKLQTLQILKTHKKLLITARKNVENRL